MRATSKVRDLPCFEFRTTVVELYRVRCLDCGVKTEKVPQLPSKAPFSKRFEEAVGLACESAAVRRVARQFGLSSSTVRAMDLRYLRRWAEGRRKPALRQMGVDEIYLGKKQKFLTVVSNLETGAAVVRTGAEETGSVCMIAAIHPSAPQFPRVCVSFRITNTLSLVFTKERRRRGDPKLGIFEYRICRKTHPTA